MIVGIKTEIKWMNDIAKTPLIGGIFIFILIFIPAVLLSFVVNTYVPGLQDDIGFTKAMLIILPSWNLFLWLIKIKLYCIILPAWILFGIIAIIKAISLFT